MKAYVSKKDKKIILNKGKFLQFVRVGEWEYCERVNCSAIVIIVPVTKENEVIFVEQYRPPLAKRVIEFPAGLINDSKARKKESMIVGAQRELMEETGYKAGKIKKVLSGPVSSGSSADLVTMLLATDLVKVSKGGGVEFESIVVHKIPFKKIERWLESMKNKGRLVEPKIYTGLYFLNNYNEGSVKFRNNKSSYKS